MMTVDREDIGAEVLPISDRPHVGVVACDAKDPDASFPAIEPLRPPVGAPNVLVVLLDDVGFGASSAFGGPVSTPTVERLAGGGLRSSGGKSRPFDLQRGRPPPSKGVVAQI